MLRAARTGVVVLNYGDSTDTLACLSSLEASHDLDIDLVVVDNGPDDEAHGRLREAVGGRGEVVATGENLGYAAGNNLGMARVLARGCELVWVINPDTRVDPETLPRLRTHLDTVRDCGIVGPRLLLPGSPTRIWFDGGLVDEELATTRHLRLGVLEEHAPKPEAVDVGYVTGAAMLARRSMIEQVGPIPEHYFLYHEEVDWCRRAQTAGWRTMVDQSARMVHLKRSSGWLPKPYYVYYMTRSRYLFAESCLGVDAERALEHFHELFLDPWRGKVQARAPHWLAAFDDLVSRAEADGRAGIHGRNDAITSYPAAEDVHERPEV